MCLCGFEGIVITKVLEGNSNCLKHRTVSSASRGLKVHVWVGVGMGVGGGASRAGVLCSLSLWLQQSSASVSVYTLVSSCMDTNPIGLGAKFSHHFLLITP